MKLVEFIDKLKNFKPGEEITDMPAHNKIDPTKCSICSKKFKEEEKSEIVSDVSGTLFHRACFDNAAGNDTIKNRRTDNQLPYKVKEDSIEESIRTGTLHPIKTKYVIKELEKILIKLKGMGIVERYSVKKITGQIPVKIKGISPSFKISLTKFNPLSLTKQDKQKGRRMKLKNSLIGKIKTPGKLFKFKEYGFYEIFKTFIDFVQDYVIENKETITNSNELLDKLPKARTFVNSIKKIDNEEFEITADISNTEY